MPPRDSVRVVPRRRPLRAVDDTATTQEATIPRATAPVLSCWDLGPGDRLAPGRRVVRRLGGGGAHEAFLVDAEDVGGRAVAKLLRPSFARDLGRLRRLRDEGRARPMAATARLVGPAGTWSYMAPEQRAVGAIAPGGAMPGPPADVFALAVSLGQALTGRLVRSPGRGELPGAVGALLREAMAPAPGDRPRAAELAGGLEALAGGRG